VKACYVRLPDSRTGDARLLAADPKPGETCDGLRAAEYGDLPVGTIVLEVARLRMPSTYVAPAYRGGIVVSEAESAEEPIKWGLLMGCWDGERRVQVGGEWVSVGAPPDRPSPPQVATSEGELTQ
jgi:hypothetical protein